MSVPMMYVRPMRMGVDLRFMAVVVMVGRLRIHSVVCMVVVPVGMVVFVLVLQRLMGVVMSVLIPEKDNQ